MPLTADFRPMIGQSTDGMDAPAHLTAQIGQLIQSLPNSAVRVGTCPNCGYPSLDSMSCAFCRTL